MTLFSGKGIVSHKFSGHVPQFRPRVYRQFWGVTADRPLLSGNEDCGPVLD